jgi:hypothetical protein
VHLFSILSEAYDKVQDKPTEVFVLQQDESNDSSPAPPPEMMPPPQLPSHATKPRKTRGYKSSTPQETSLFIFIGFCNCYCSIVNIIFSGVNASRWQECWSWTLKGLSTFAKRSRSGCEKLKIQFSSKLGGPYGENRRTFVDEIVVHTRQRAP